jgi:hypothetical protein
MSEKIKALEVNALTGEETIRELTQEEILERNERATQSNFEIEARSLLRESALAKLAALGLTEEEIGAL